MQKMDVDEHRKNTLAIKRFLSRKLTGHKSPVIQFESIELTIDREFGEVEGTGTAKPGLGLRGVVS